MTLYQMLLRVGDRRPELTAVEVLEIRQHCEYCQEPALPSSFWCHISRNFQTDCNCEAELELATLFGQYRWEAGSPVGADGRTTPHTSSWIRELVDDLAHLAAPELVPDQPLALFSNPCRHHFIAISIRTALGRRYRAMQDVPIVADLARQDEGDEVAEDRAPLLCDFVGPDGALRGYRAQSTTALSTHKRRAHSIRMYSHFGSPDCGLQSVPVVSPQFRFD
eukprot:s2573_g11.t1